jgi:hypothetical protein
MDVKPKRRWFRFSLRTLLLLVTLACAGFSWLASRMNEARAQRLIVQEIRQLGGKVFYDYQIPEAVSDDVVVGDDGIRYPLSRGCPIFEVRQPPGPRWLHKLLGEDFFANVIRVRLSCTEVTDADLMTLRGLHSLKSVSLEETNVSDQAIAEFEAAMPGVEVNR